MPLTVNTNIASLNAQRNVGISNSQLSKSLERLSSGLRINKAADDAAGLAIATKFAAQVRGLNQAARNANNAVSLAQTAEGGINTLTNILQRLRELAVQASSDDSTASDRANTAQEASNLITEFTRVANTTEFNTLTLLDGSFSGRYFQIGANYSQNITFAISDIRGRSVGGEHRRRGHNRGKRRLHRRRVQDQRRRRCTDKLCR
jgi:flagellin